MAEPAMDNNRSLLHTELCKIPELYELHTHLLGMGNADFWINTVLTNQFMLPTNDQFRHDTKLRRRLGPLVWCKNKFIDRKRTADFFDHLRLHGNVNFYGQDNEIQTLNALNTDELRRKMHHRNLSFEKDFSYDVVLSMDNIAKAFSLSNPNPDIIQIMLEEKLGVYKQETYSRSPFKYWIIFNARAQKMKIAYGMTVEKLCQLIGNDTAIENISNPAMRDARAHIINAFSMCNADGTMPRSIDYYSFRGLFTPEFYPRRFALKDSLYEQRLDILALLLQHVLRRYQTCFPPLKYCEFSVGVGDLSKPHIVDILRSFPSHDDIKRINPPYTEFQTGFSRQLITIGKNTTDHRNIKPPEQKRAIQLLAEAPQLAIYHMLNEILRSINDYDTNLFVVLTDQLSNFEKKTDEIKSFYDWVVGLDLFGDELGFPYCPFVAKEFLEHVNTRRKYNPNYGLRIHGGENVAAINSALPGYHVFVAHMYIFLLGIEYLKQKLHYGIRVGHGIAFNIVFEYDGLKESSSRKSSVLMAEMKELSRKILQDIALEVNITSNFYLLGESVRRGGNDVRTYSLDRFFTSHVPIVLSTDNDGIWPIDFCQLKHFGHHSLAAEYCRAIYSGIIHNQTQLDNIILDSKRFCFDKYLRPLHINIPQGVVTVNNRFRNPMVALHPKLIRYILEELYSTGTTIPEKPFYDYCLAMYPDRIYDNQYNLSKEQCGNLAPIALAITYLCNQPNWPLRLYEIEYNNMFHNSQGRHYQKHMNVWKKCQEIFNKLMHRSKDNISADYRVWIKNENNPDSSIRFMSMQHFPSDPIPQVLIDHVTNANCHDSLIFSFCSKLDIKETRIALNHRWGERFPKTPDRQLIVYLHSNMNKYDYADVNEITKIILKANCHPDVRTNSDDDPEEHALYAICPHGSAATAALHFMAKYEGSPKIKDNSSDPDSLSYTRSNKEKSENNKENTTRISSTTTSQTTLITDVIEYCQYPNVESYKQSCIVLPFNQLIVPFLPMKVNIPFTNHSHFYDLYNINKSSKLANQFQLQNSSTLSYDIDENYSFLFYDTIHSRMNWSTLYNETRNEMASHELIRAMLDMTRHSLQQYDICPTSFALLRATPKREALRKSLKLLDSKILVPIEKIDKNSKLLICTQIQRFPMEIRDLKFPVTNRVSFDLAYILWIQVHHGKPFENLHLALNKAIVFSHLNELQEIANRFNEPTNDVWGYFIILTIIQAGAEIWNSTTINKWCDFMNNAFPNDERIDMFKYFLKSHNLRNVFQSTLNDQSPGKLGDEEQLNVMKMRIAYEIQVKLLRQDPSRYYDHLVVWLDARIGEPQNNIEMRNRFERNLQNEDSISSHALFELQEEAFALQLFSDKEKCLEFIKSIVDKKIFFITSGSLGSWIVPKLVGLTQIKAIYIFCGDIFSHMKWASDYIDDGILMLDHEDGLLLRLMNDVHNYLQEINEDACVNIKKQIDILRRMTGDLPLTQMDESLFGRMLSPLDYDRVIREKTQAERDVTRTDEQSE